MSIIFDGQKWVQKCSNRIPPECKTIFENILQNKIIFNNQKPMFFDNKITYKQWINSSDISNFEPQFFGCDDNTISQLYFLKGCNYIQISGKGLYHTGIDVCNFGVPYFKCPQKLMIKVKVHKKKNNKGFLEASVIATPVPIMIDQLPAS